LHFASEFKGEGSLFQAIEIDPSYLPFAHLDPNGDILGGNITLKTPEQTLLAEVKPENINGDWQPPGSVIFLVPNSDFQKTGFSVQIANATFQMKGIGPDLRWKYVGKTMEETFGGLSAVITRGDLETDQ
jgi:hypothetical protein